MLPISKFFAKYFIYFNPIEQGPIFQKMTVKFREVKIVPGGHTASRRTE